MKRLICIAWLALIATLTFKGVSAHAQSQDLQKDVQILAQRVDSLEHELSYLKLNYELNKLNSDITMFANEVSTKSVGIQLNFYNRNFYSKLGDAYQRYYESCQYRKRAISENIEASKTFYMVKVMTYPYTENELEVLKASYNVIDNAFDTLETSMDVLKNAIDAYNKFL